MLRCLTYSAAADDSPKPSARDPESARAAVFCREAVRRTKGTDPDAFSGLASALDLLGDHPGAVDAAAKAVSLVPNAAPSRQRKEMEELLQRMTRASRR